MSAKEISFVFTSLTHMTRRSFVGASALIAGAIALGACSPPSEPQEPAAGVTEAETDTERGCAGPEAMALARKIVERSSGNGLTVCSAESCTGGLVTAALTDIPGSSSAVIGGVCSYATSVKESVLGVPTNITQDDAIGVVSAECAKAMATGVRSLMGADIAVSTTGLAGPGGGEPGKPVGTVWFAIDSARGTSSVSQHFEGDRTRVREQATAFALGLILEEMDALEAKPPRFP
jgi:nicotinamide-nucleotide amidase